MLVGAHQAAINYLSKEVSTYKDGLEHLPSFMIKGFTGTIHKWAITQSKAISEFINDVSYLDIRVEYNDAKGYVVSHGYIGHTLSAIVDSIATNRINGGLIINVKVLDKTVRIIELETTLSRLSRHFIYVNYESKRFLNSDIIDNYWFNVSSGKELIKAINTHRYDTTKKIHIVQAIITPSTSSIIKSITSPCTSNYNSVVTAGEYVKTLLPDMRLREIVASMPNDHTFILLLDNIDSSTQSLVDRL